MEFLVATEFLVTTGKQAEEQDRQQRQREVNKQAGSEP